jgi:hypothetical protein
MGHGDRCALVAVFGALLGEVGVQGMLRAGGVVGRFTQHGAQFSGAAFGDPAVHIARPRLMSRGGQAGVARRVLCIGKALHIGEDCDHRRGDDGPHAGDRLEALELGHERPLVRQEEVVQRAELLARTAPQRPMLFEVGAQVRNSVIVITDSGHRDHRVSGMVIKAISAS